MAKSPTSIIAADGSTLTLDATITYTLSSSVDVTEHPVEDGADIGDHAQRKPKLLTIRGIVTESPFSNVDDTGGLARVQRALEFLDSIAGTLVTVVTQAFGTMESMAITRYPTTRDRLRKLEFELEFKQVRVATASLVSITPDTPISTDANGLPVSAAVGLPDEQEAGEQSTTDTSAASTGGATQAEADKSLLLEITEALGIAPEAA